MGYVMSSFKRSACPVANLLEIFGDKWTLLVVRDLMMGKQTYKAFHESAEGIPTNILADRLKRLEKEKIIEKSKYQDRPVRYAYKLTQKGKDLGPALWSMVEWSNKYIPGTRTAEEIKNLIKN